MGELILKDDQNNSAILAGNIHHDYFLEFQLDLSITTDRFAFLNTPPKNNPILCVTVLHDADLSITAPPDLIRVDAAARTLENTAITLSPFSKVEVILREDILSYGKPEDFVDGSPEELLRQARTFPFDVNLLFETNDLATLKVIIDPVKGDEISGNDTGNLSIDIPADGQQQVFGTYYVNSGKYSFSYDNLISREFEIEEGNTASFNGDPLDAQLDFKAVYKVQSSSSSKPGAIVPAMHRQQAALRQNPNELNNQVFGLLLFNRFLPLSVRGGT